MTIAGTGKIIYRPPRRTHKTAFRALRDTRPFQVSPSASSTCTRLLQAQRESVCWRWRRRRCENRITPVTAPAEIETVVTSRLHSLRGFEQLWPVCVTYQLTSARHPRPRVFIAIPRQSAARMVRRVKACGPIFCHFLHRYGSGKSCAKSTRGRETKIAPAHAKLAEDQSRKGAGVTGREVSHMWPRNSARRSEARRL